MKNNQASHTQSNRKTCDKAFQRSAAEMVLVGGKMMVQVARDLGINQHTLKNWKNKYLKEMGEVQVHGQTRSAALDRGGEPSVA